MPILPILKIRLFSVAYKSANISDRQNVTNVVKNYVKKLSVSGLGIEKSGLAGCLGKCPGVRFQVSDFPQQADQVAEVKRRSATSRTVQPNRRPMIKGDPDFSFVHFLINNDV
jgi:hypothetical protein